MKPRFYQQESHDAFFKAIETPGINPLIGMPCGTGKSLVNAMLATTACRWQGVRYTCLVNSKKLVSQNAKTLMRYNPNADLGIYCDGLDSKDASRQITFGTIQSAAKNYKEFGKQNILFIDEAQNVSPNEETQYQEFIQGLRDRNPNLVVGGGSATLYRSKGGMLIDHGLFNKVCYDITGWQAFEALVKMYYLVPLTSNPTKFSFDVTGIKTSGDDFNQKQLQELVDDPDANRRALREALNRGHDRKHWIIFCAGIKHVEMVHDILKGWGHKVAMAHSKMKGNAADLAIEAYECGGVRMLVSDNMLTVGFDAPFTDHIVVLRPSKAVVRHVQGLGRGTRPWYAPGFDLDILEERKLALEASGRVDCLVSDFGKNLERLGPVNDPNIPGKRLGKGELPIKICRTDKLLHGAPRGLAIGCGEYNFTAARFCCRCQQEFLFEDREKVEKKASDAVATRLSDNSIVARWIPVERRSYTTYQRGGGKPSMMVTYFTPGGLQGYSEFVSVEHAKDVVRDHSNRWWRKHGIEWPPVYTENGLLLMDDLPCPKWILVQLNLKHPKIISHSFDIDEPPIFNPETGKLETPSHDPA